MKGYVPIGTGFLPGVDIGCWGPSDPDHMRPENRPACQIARLILAVGMMMLPLNGCSSSQQSSDPADPGASIRTRTDRPLAIVDGQPIHLADLSAGLIELAGGPALEEVVLDLMLSRRVRQQGLRIGPEEIERERSLLIDALAAAAGDPAQGARMLMDLREARGLGAVRFPALLKRSATLRALVQPNVGISDNLVRAQFGLEFGERRRARIITVATLADAQAAAGALAQGAPFNEVAARRSTDSSATRGGLVEPISLIDPSYPAGIRAALGKLTLGETSRPISFGGGAEGAGGMGGYAILRLEEVIPAQQVVYEDVLEGVTRRARLREERGLMDRLSLQLIESAGVTVLDRNLGRSWEARLGNVPGS